MAKLRYLASEKNLLRLSVNAGHTSWGNRNLDDIKIKIKDYHIDRQSECCSYCRRNIAGEFRMVLDIEHILPKSAHVKYMFTQKNLTVACKRCNMNIKGKDLSFLNPPALGLPKRAFRSRYYKLIHPNLDNFKEHLMYYHAQVDTKKIIKYVVQNDSEKGQFNYDYFKLNRLERNVFDEAQDASERVEVIDPIISAMFEELNERFNT